MWTPTRLSNGEGRVNGEAMTPPGPDLGRPPPASAGAGLPAPPFSFV